MHGSALRIVGLFLLLVSAWKSCEYLASGADQHGPGAAAVRDWGDWLFAGVAGVGLYGLTLRETRRGVRRDTRQDTGREAPPPQTPAQLLRAQRLESIGILARRVPEDGQEGSSCWQVYRSSVVAPVTPWLNFGQSASEFRPTGLICS